MSSISSSQRILRKRKLMPVRTVIPWRYPEEFLKVYQYLFDNDITKKRWAVEQITVWNTRCHPCLPTAIEATLVLTQAVIQDILFVNGTTFCQEGDIQLLYCMALIRFINLTVELYQASDKRTIAQTAQNLGIPCWIVDLRNEASHSVSPSLPTLRMGAVEALKYLHDSYWKIESSRLNSILEAPPDFDEIKAALRKYQISQCMLLASKVTDEKYKTLTNLTEKRLKALVYLFCRNRLCFLKVLVSENFMIIPESDMRMLLLDKEIADLLDDDSDVDDDEDVKESSFRFILPISLERLWAPLLVKINAKNAFTDLVEALLSTQKRDEIAQQKLLIAWVIKILKLAINPNIGKSPLSIIFQKRCPLFNWNRLLHAALRTPCQFTAYLLPMIACHMDSDKDVLRKKLQLLAISQGQAIDSNRRFKETCAFTLEMLKKAKKIQGNEIKRRKMERNGIKEEEQDHWLVGSENIVWNTIPTGQVYNAALEEAEDIEEAYQVDLIEEQSAQREYISGNVNLDEIEPIFEENTDNLDKKTLKGKSTFWFTK